MSTYSTTLQLRIELRQVKPKVWRRVLVPASITLRKLHVIIQTLMDWNGGHLHEFVIAHKHYGPQSDDGNNWDGPETLPENKIALANAFNGVKSACYTYDFGDDWQVDIKVEPLAVKYKNTKGPVCVAGKNAGPLEDSGGVYGYEDFCRIAADPTDPEHEERLEWAGCDEWNPEEFDIEAINQQLSRLR